MRLLPLALAALALGVGVTSASAHTTAPTNLVVKGVTTSSVSLDWAQDYVDSYSGYYVRVDDGPRVAYPSSEGAVFNLRAGTSYRFCVSINFTSSTHPDESNQACLTATTTGTAPTPTPTATPTATPTPPPSGSSVPRFTWTKSSSAQAEFDKVKSLGFTHAMVDPDSAQLAKLAAAGLRAILWGGNYSDSCAWNWSDATFASKVNAAKTSPYANLIDGVFIADEPHGPGSGACPNSPADLQARNNLSKSLLPGAYTLISENRKPDWQYVANIADVFLPIIYPCSYSGGCAPSKIDEGVSLMNMIGVRNYWATVQAFSEPSGGYYRAPSAAEEQVIFDRWHSLGDPLRMSGWWAYTWGDGCCGDDVGLRDLSALWPVWQQENAR